MWRIYIYIYVRYCVRTYCTVLAAALAAAVGPRGGDMSWEEGKE